MAIPTKEQVLDAIRPVQDPEIRIGIVDLGLIYDVDIDDKGSVKVKMTLTTPGCPFGEMLMTDTHRAVEDLKGVTEVEIILVWEPVWNPEEMCSDVAKDQLGIW